MEFTTKNWFLFLTLCSLHVLLTYSCELLFVSENLIYQTYGEQMAVSRIYDMLNYRDDWKWLGHAFLPFLIFFRLLYTSICIYIGMYFTELELGICKLFKITLWADFVYVISGLTKLIFFIFFKQVSSLFDLQYTPFSILNLLDKSIISPLFEYPLSLLNLFELSYFLVLAWLLLEVMKRDNREISFGYGRSLKLITVSYGGGLLLWVVFVMFITINLT